jgi:hypothetical protein
MTALEELRDAMESPPDFEPVVLNLDHVMAAGGRIRRRRTAGAVAASGAAVVALLVAGSQLTSLAATTTSGSAPAGSAPWGLAPSGSAPSGAVPSGSVPSGSAPAGLVPSVINSSAPGILGTVVETGRWVDGRQWIIYAETVDPDDLNGTLTLVLGRTKTGYINDFTRDVIAGDSGTARMSPGFHAVRAGTVIGGRTTPTFGYYTGAAARITARDATGKTVQAHLTAWSGFGATEKAQIFWFDFVQGNAPASLTALTAYDKSGKELPAGS